MAKFSAKSGSGAKAPAKPKSRWADVKAKNDGPEIVHKGDYRLRVDSSSEDKNWASIVFTVLEERSGDKHADQPGDEVKMLEDTTAKYDLGLRALKACIMAVIGCPDEDEFSEFDPDGEFLDACMGVDNSRRAQAEELFFGKEVDVKVFVAKLREKNGAPMIDKRTGEQDYFRGYNWTINEPEDDAA